MPQALLAETPASCQSKIYAQHYTRLLKVVLLSWNSCRRTLRHRRPDEFTDIRFRSADLHYAVLMQRIHLGTGVALCRFCGQTVPTNRLSTHIASEHPRQKSKNLRPRLVKRPKSLSK
jgi:hypothetical protein